MRPKTFPATSYVGNSRQRLQEIREGLKQPPKSSSQGLNVGSNNETQLDPKATVGKDATRQQQMRPVPKFGPYQKALREIRNSLMPFANESGSSLSVEVNRQMLQELVNAGCEQEMAIRALKQTGSRSIEAALDYISKMGYLDPRTEQIVRVIKQTSPGKGIGPHLDRRPSFEGSNDSLSAYHQMGNPIYEVADSGAESGNIHSELSRQYANTSNINFLVATGQAMTVNNPGQRCSPIGPHPTISGQNPPSNNIFPPIACDIKHQQKTYSAKGETGQTLQMISYTLSNHSSQPIALQGSQVSNNPHYMRQHLIAQGDNTVSLGYPVQRSSSFQNKIQQEGSYGSLQNKNPVAQGIAAHTFQQPPTVLYLPQSHHRQQSPTSPQIQMLPSHAPPFGNDFSELAPNMMTPSRNSLNMEIFDINTSPMQHWQVPSPTRRDSMQNTGLETLPRSAGHLRPDAKIPNRTNSFNNKLQTSPSVRQVQTSKTEPSLNTTNTITAVTSTPFLQQVRSTRVPRPEPQTAVAPSHAAWLQTQGTDNNDVMDQKPLAVGGAVVYPLEPDDYTVKERRCPPPPYPKHLLLQNSAEQFDTNSLCMGVDQNIRGIHSLTCNETEGNSNQKSEKSSKPNKLEKIGKDKKLIQTSPVPVRKNSKDEEKRESRIKSYSPFAFKFFMEQHVENIMKTYQQKLNRRLQLEQEMSKAGLSEAEQEQMRKMLNQKESNYNRLKRAKMDKSLFVKIKTLGVGAFGEVCLAQKVDTNALYAMKTLRKKDVLSRNQVAHVKAERDILAEADNEWVVKLYYSFQDKDSLYFVMDYIPGGDMMSLLIRMGVFPESLARFYIGELTLAIESVHKMGFIHRDIKPDNILIDLDGHIKLTDFGLCTGFRWTHDSKYYQKGSHARQDSMEPSDLWGDLSDCKCGDRLKTLEQRAARQHQRCLAHSLVGTPNYIAPEVLVRKGYTQLCDWWSVGVILFEMLVGQPPFLAPTPAETQIKVINWESTLYIPPQVKLSSEAIDLITKLCCGANDRLGGNGADEIKAHPFFTSIDFSKDIRRQPAPYVPKISHPMDTSNFDPIEEENSWNDSSDSTKTSDTLTSHIGGNKHPEHAFYEFTFRRFFDDHGYPFRYPKPLENNEPKESQPDLGQSESVNHGESYQPVYV
ncbi:serine/threonine-protein kinase LATS2 [Pristis pectinata]|uniref:serine/threonine-protein kinase LATS2 n=1 Tax=Pristis pectinata TaxID=685728 RepID=UPI00223CF7C8|nr:serine/threonine-protein kinase LATS2 [Pristis pectinata]XP_051882441.1 serine/threonine-protein kinase LATS2 [Pristis pectinata]